MNLIMLGSVEILLNGELHIEYDMTLEMDSSAGTIPNNNGIRIFLRSGANGAITRIWNGTREALSGTGSRAQYTAIRLLDNVEPGDRILVFFKFNTGGSASWSNVEVDNASYILRLRPKVSLEYSVT